MEKMKIYKETIRLWGIDTQIDMMVEECAELIQALQQYKRNTSLKTINNIYEELADVEIMSEQMRVIYNPYNIDSIKKRKIRRLENMIKGGI